MKNIHNYLLSIIIILLSAQLLLQLNAIQKVSFGEAITSNKHEGVPAVKSMPDLPKTSIHFDSVTHNFGIIKDDKKQYTAFQFTNSGKEPLLILGAEGSCGCTVPTWPRDPIAPGKTANIEVAFDPNGKSGEHSKVITITANTEPSTTILSVQANIIKSN